MAKTNAKNKTTKIKRGSDGKFQDGSVSNGNKESKSGGRPSAVSQKTLERLIAAFKVGADDRTACDYAEISYQTLYNYQEKHPEFIERKEGYKREPVLKARTIVVKALETSVSVAQWYLERKASKEFGLRAGGETEKMEFAPPKTEREAKLQLMVLNKHHDYVESRIQNANTQGSP